MTLKLTIRLGTDTQAAMKKAKMTPEKLISEIKALVAQYTADIRCVLDDEGGK